MYPSDGALHSHQDGVKGQVLGLTLGQSTMFHFSPTQKEKDRTEVLLESGDLILFDGGKLWHGVDKIIPDTAPQWWKDMQVSYGKFWENSEQYRGK